MSDEKRVRVGGNSRDAVALSVGNEAVLMDPGDARMIAKSLLAAAVDVDHRPTTVIERDS